MITEYRYGRFRTKILALAQKYITGGMLEKKSLVFPLKKFANI